MLIIHFCSKWPLRWSLSYINLIFKFLNDCCLSKAEIYFLSLFPTVTLSKVYSDSEPLFICHKRLWCNIFLKAPWMERVALTAFICKSLGGSVLLTYKSWRHQCLTLVCGGKHQICTNGEKKKKTLLTTPCLIYTLIRSKQQLRATVSCKCYSTICGKSHTQAQTCKINQD